jgi:hypothetical protein
MSSQLSNKMRYRYFISLSLSLSLSLSFESWVFSSGNQILTEILEIHGRQMKKNEISFSDL